MKPIVPAVVLREIQDSNRLSEAKNFIRRDMERIRNALVAPHQKKSFLAELVQSHPDLLRQLLIFDKSIQQIMIQVVSQE